MKQQEVEEEQRKKDSPSSPSLPFAFYLQARKVLQFRITLKIEADASARDACLPIEAKSRACQAAVVLGTRRYD
ncbi:hypothetical protein VZT92_017982 [Zoarces viviparus]|uniref:Uncharacterized protein n=1 Tax=Zoarces viviparus TaxID=48416 RepID=A0AAW1EPE2_ZOAVI